jgi:mitochondrial import inner membrane translocase subunit TIM44
MLNRNIARVASASSLTRAHPTLLRHRVPRRLNVPAASNAFSTSSHRYQEAPKSPFQTFVEVLRDEIRKNRELQDNVKQLQGDVDKLQDSEAMKRAREAYERARV